MKFKNSLAIAILLVAAVHAEVAESAAPSLSLAEGAPTTPTEAPVPRELEAKNTNVDMSQFEQLRLRHSIKLLPGAKKSVKEVSHRGPGRKLDGSSESDFLPEPVKEKLKEMAVEAIKDHVASEVDNSADSLNAAPDSLQATPQAAEEAFYEDGTGLFIAQEQKRILLLQFYEVILNNPKRTPQVDPRIIKLMTNYLQTLEYVYVKQIQHREESPPVLYDYKADNETASFCDSPAVSLPDQKFLNEDDDYFVKLFDQYNQQQLGVYMSPTQLKQQGLFRKLARHLAEAQVSEDQRREADQLFSKAPQAIQNVGEDAQTPQERSLKSADKKEKKTAAPAKPEATKEATKEVPTHFKVIEPSDIDLNSDFDFWVPPKGKSKKSRQLKRSVAAAEEPVESKRQLRARRNPVRENVDGDFPAPIDDPFPIHNANLFRENIMDDTMEILDFFTRQLDIIFQRMERLNAANRGLTTWHIKPHWRDFEEAIQYFQALASRTNRITDVLDLIIEGTADKSGVGFMGHFFGELDRIRGLNRRLANLNQVYSTATIHLRNMLHQLHQMRVSQASVPPQRRQVLMNQINAQQLAINRQQNMVNDLKRRVDRAHQYHREVTALGEWFNRLGNEVAKEARKVRLDYIRLELLARNMLHTTAIDMTEPRNQRMNLRFFEAAIPQMVSSKVSIIQGIQRLTPRMDAVLNSKDRIKSFLDRWSRDLHRRARVRKLKTDKDGKGLI